MKVKGSLLKQEGEFETNKEEIQTFLNVIVPTFVREGGGIISDTVKFWRWKNLVRIVKKAKDFIEEEEISPQEVPLKTTIPLLEGATLEEDASMQERWAALLSNAIAGNKDVTPSYVSILSELSPMEAMLLDKIYDEAQKIDDPEKRKNLQFSKEKVAKGFAISTTEAEIMIENLFRLGLCTPPGSSGIMTGNIRMALRTNEIFELTTLGATLVEICRFQK